MTDALNQDSTATVGDTVYPFSAIVGQEPMKLALILAAIHPGLGGVLIRGSKGAAKSTAVRALAALLPDSDVVPDDPFHRAPGEVITDWPLPDDARFTRRPVSLVNLPVGATDDRVVGSLNLERALTTGRRTFEPGLLAAAHRGRMARTKGAVLSLLIDAYQKRDRVGLTVFGGTSATLGLPPTRSVRLAARHLDELPVGGLTPLAHGLGPASRLARAWGAELLLLDALGERRFPDVVRKALFAG